ncbi:MAG: hypothetical protein KAJ96_00815 [Candidatus Thorarchaeota archaeon]|nr:hypothetical protein [Candidatus Thorarchaeota archaeon]
MSTLRELEIEQVSPRLLEVLRREGLTTLTPFQSAAVDGGILRGESQILQTYDYEEAYQIAEISLLNRVASDFKTRALVLCPNPHQAEKRFHSLSYRCKRLGIEATAIIRRRTAIGDAWKGGRVIVTTFRALDIALRIHPDAFEGIECLLTDRLDLIGQPRLGAKLETVLVTLMGMHTELQHVVVSPPVADVEDLSSWLGARIVEDTKTDMKRIFSVKAFESVNESLADLTEFVQYRRGQVAILCSNIPACEELAAQLTGISDVSKESALDLRLTPEHRDDLGILSRDIMGRYAECATSVILGRTVSRGVAFIHEGIARSQRRIISGAWEDGLVPVIIMPTRFAIASGLRATVVFLIGVFMQDLAGDLADKEELTQLSEWQLSDVLSSVGKRGVDNEAFGIVVVGTQTERHRVLARYFVEDSEGNISPRLGEVDSSMDNPENAQDLVLRQLCSDHTRDEDPFSILDRTFWASTNRVTQISRDGLMLADDADVEALISLRSTKSTATRAREIPDEDVRLVSMNPNKIEGLVHSRSRDLWHHVVVRAGEGVSCTCESWKYQGIRKHRLCKHLVRFSNFALQNDETKPYAASVIRQSLRGLKILGELEREGLMQPDGKGFRCTKLGQSVTVLGVSVSDSKRVNKALGQAGNKLANILIDVAVARTGMPRKAIAGVLDAVQTRNMEKVVNCEQHGPGIVENCLEELHYINSILAGIMGGKANKELKREIRKLDKNLTATLDTFS